VSGAAVSNFLYGKSRPKPAFIEAFTHAFELTQHEQRDLAWAYTYGYQLNNLQGRA
jgi:hypothetical protein